MSDKMDPEGNQELFSMDDIKIEVMRARGAGGQVFNLMISSALFQLISYAISM
jgi:protein subunit release factor A